MYEVIFNFLYLLCTAIFIAAVFWGTLRLMDHVGQIYFRDALDKIEQNPLAMALYFGLRLIALAILYSPLLRVLL